MPTPRLWSWNLSPYSGKARVVAAACDVELDLVEIDPRTRPAHLRELNPTNRVPVLEVDGLGIRESSAICEWLQETSGVSLWPADPSRRAYARGLMRWVDDEITLNFFRSYRVEAFGPGEDDPADMVDRLRSRLGRRWPVLEGLLAATDGPWLAGEAEPSLADLSGMAIAVRLPEWGPQLAPPPELERTVAWLEALREHPLAEQIKRRGTPVDEH